ncbi:branched-chain amino acid ABC transporter permease [Mycetohabitans rhizoxinica]|uniref:branched-chain amino acid ABC transporter permease n=1 Tax=Mycetohabitans rhizoxinica TaxID=412963 RepID=UPI0030D4DD10
MQSFVAVLLNGLSYGLLLFLLCAGLTLVFSLMGVMNFAHASFYMLGAYIGYTSARYGGFAAALILAPAAVAGLAAAFELGVLRRVHRQGPLAQLLATFGLAYLIAEFVQLGWGRSPLPAVVPQWLDGALVNWHGVAFSRLRAFMMAISAGVLGLCALLLRYSRLGLMIAAARTHPHAVQALGHDVARVHTQVFACGAALAAVAGVLGGVAFVTDTSMAETLGSVVFAIVVAGGMGSLAGAFAASLLFGIVQTLLVGLDIRLGALLHWVLPTVDETGAWGRITLAQLAPVTPFVLLIIVLALRPGGLVRGHVELDT